MKESLLSGLLSCERLNRYSRELMVRGVRAERIAALRNHHLFVDESLLAAALYLVAGGIGRVTPVAAESESDSTHSLKDEREFLLQQLGAVDHSVTVYDTISYEAVDGALRRSLALPDSRVVLFLRKAIAPVGCHASDAGRVVSATLRSDDRGFSIGSGSVDWEVPLASTLGVAARAGAPSPVFPGALGGAAILLESLLSSPH